MIYKNIKKKYKIMKIKLINLMKSYKKKKMNFKFKNKIFKIN